MSSPLAPILANIFMIHYEERAFSTYNGIPPVYYRRIMDLKAFKVFLLVLTVLAHEQYVIARSVDMNINVGNLAACLEACAGGGAAIQAFCRTIPIPYIRAACWAVQFATPVACNGFCYMYFGDSKDDRIDENEIA